MKTSQNAIFEFATLELAETSLSVAREKRPWQHLVVPTSRKLKISVAVESLGK